MNTFRRSCFCGDKISIQVKDIRFDIPSEIQNQIIESNVKEVIVGIFPVRFNLWIEWKLKLKIEQLCGGLVEFIESRGQGE